MRIWRKVVEARMKMLLQMLLPPATDTLSCIHVNLQLSSFTNLNILAELGERRSIIYEKIHQPEAPMKTI